MEKSYPILGLLRTCVLPWLAAFFPVIIPATSFAGLITTEAQGMARGFIENVGQIKKSNGETAREVKYFIQRDNLTIFFGNDGISYVSNHKLNANADASKHNRFSLASGQLKQYRFDVEFVNGNSQVELLPEAFFSERISYYNAENPKGSDALHLSSMIYKDVYKGIDLRFYLNEESNLKYDFIVHPGADPSQIALKYRGAQKLILNGQGEVEVSADGGVLIEEAPYSYTNKDEFVPSEYRLNGDVLTFSIGQYDRSKTLTIDPTLIWSTYFGDSGDDLGLALCGDNAGNVITTGYTTSTSFPVSTGAHQVAIGGLSDVYVSKFDNTGSRLWTTYFGGAGEDRGYDVAVDGSANVFVTGYSMSPNFPVSVGAFQTSNAGIADAFLLKFNPAGTLQFATLLGGASDDYGYGVKVDGTGNVFVAGNSQSNNFPVTLGALQSTSGGGADVFISKFTNLGLPLWITYHGGTLGDEAYGLALDASGNPIVVGRSFSTNYPVTSGAFQSTKAGGDDMIITKFSTLGTLTWSTYYGGSSDDYGYGIDLDASGNIYVSGYTASTNFPITAGAHQNTYGGGLFDGFAAKLSSTGGQLWSTYYGGNANDQAYAMTADPSGTYYIAGLTQSTNLDVTSDAFQPSKSTGNDAFIASFDGSGNHTYGTYFGGNNDDYGYDIIWNTGASLLEIVGATISTDFPVTGNAYQTNNEGSIDMFLSAFCSSILNNTVSVNGNDSAEICVNGPFPLITGSSPSGTGPFTFQWQSSANGSTWTNISGGTAQDYQVTTLTGTTWFRRVVSNPICSDTSNVVYLQLNPPPTAGIATTQGCVGNVTSFSSISTNGSTSDTIVSYNWSFGDGGTSTVKHPGHTYTAAGSYAVTLIVTSAAGCSDTATISIQVDTPPVVAFTAQTNCNNNTVTFTDNTTPTSGYIAFWNWSFGDNTYANTQNPVHVYSAPGTYTVWLIATTNGGCADTLIQTINVGSPVNASFTASAACEGAPTQFTNTSSGSTSFWSWNFGDGNTSTSQNPSHTYANAGTYTVTFVTGSPGCTDTVTQTVNVTGSPNAGFSTLSTCLGSTVTFTDTSSVTSGSITSWSWNFGDGNTSTSQNPVHTYGTNGSYVVQLIVVATGGCSDTITRTITIGTATTAAFSVGGNCAGQNVQFTDNSTGSPSTWLWNFGDGNTSTAQNPMHSYAAGGTYNITLIVSNGTCQDTVTQSVTFLDGPTANFTYTGGCNGLPVNFTSTSTTTGGTITGYNWNFGNGNTSTLQNPTVSFTGSGPFSVRLIVTTSNGCTDTIVQTLIPDLAPVASFTSANRCIGDPVAFTSTSTSNAGPITSYNWNFGDGGTSTLQNPSHVYTSGTTFTVSLIVGTANGCSDTATQTITLDPKPVAEFSYEANCVGSEVIFTDASSGSNRSWNWTFGNGLSSTLQNPTTVYTTSGPFTVQLIVTSVNGCVDTVTQTVTILPAPVVNAGPDVTINSGASTTLNATSTPTGTFTWSPVTGLSSSTVHNPVASPDETTTYIVTVVTDEGCTASDTMTVTVDGRIKVPTAFTPNNDGSNDFWEIPRLRGFPDALVMVYNRWGSEVHNTTDYESNPWYGTYNGEMLPAGAYFYVIDLRDGSDPLKGTVTILK